MYQVGSKKISIGGCMQRGMAKRLLGMAVMGLMFPLSVYAAEADLQLKIDQLSKEVNDLKGSVKKVEDKSIGRWLTIGGEYRFRVDSMHGQTAAYRDVNQTFTNAQNALQGAFFADPTGTSPYFGPAPNANALTALSLFSQNMKSVRTYQQAVNFPSGMSGGFPNSNLMAGMAAFAADIPAFKPKNETLYTNKFGLDLTAKATQDITVHAKLGMYKSFGSQDDSQVTGNYFSDRVGVFDGTLGHIPSESLLNVDRAYATWSNIADQPIWFSVGRRPSTDGAPSNLRLNKERPGNGGVPSLMVNYAYDGMTVGYAPDIDALPGAYIKLCYGRGFDSGIKTSVNSIKDMDMTGVIINPIDTDPLRVWFQWNHAYDLLDFPVMKDTAFGNTAPSTNLGDIDWLGAGALSTLKNVGPGSLNLFADIAVSMTHPNNNVSAQAGFQGLLTGAFFSPEKPTDKNGWAVAAGVRYDLPSKTKIGFEFNHGSENWITMAFAADDMWTSKVGTRGNVYEPYIIQELNLKPISSHFSKAFFKLGYQYYDFEFTGSNNWVGAPVKISDIKATDMMMMAPVKNAHNVYGTFEVQF
jgi:hypothetical protein